MFHDTNLQQTAMASLAFDLNAHACRLALLVQWYKQRGERTLPVDYLKRLAFTRRQWELATKGSRRYEGRKLADAAPAPDGCEFLGLVSEYKTLDPETGTPKTYWVIGEIDADALQAIRDHKEASCFDVLEDRKPERPCEGEPVEPSTKPDTQHQSEADYDLGYAHGEAAGYAKGCDDTRCVYDASLDKGSRDAAKTHPAKVSVKPSTLNTLLKLIDLGNERLAEKQLELEAALSDQKFSDEFDAAWDASK